MFKISITGDKEIDKIFNQLEPKNMKNVLINASRQAAGGPLSYMQRSFPKLTGKAAASFKIRPGSRRGERQGFFGVKIWSGKRTELGIDPGSKYYYPAAIEFGTEKIPAARVGPKAVNAWKSRVRDKFASAVRNQIKKLIQRHAKKGTSPFR